MAPPPTGGSGATTGEYVALSTVGEEGSNEKGGLPRPTSPPPTAIAKGVSFIKKDLRVKFAAIFVGLWILNEICERGSSTLSRAQIADLPTSSPLRPGNKVIGVSLGDESFDSSRGLRVQDQGLNGNSPSQTSERASFNIWSSGRSLHPRKNVWTPKLQLCIATTPVDPRLLGQAESTVSRDPTR